MSPKPASDPQEFPDHTQVQAEPPATMDSSVETTNPTFSITPGGPPGFPFLSPPQSQDELGRLGDYRILQLLGEGGMGFVFRAEDPALKRFIALKVMHAEIASKANAAERFLREGRAAAGLKSDHIITIYQVGQANGVPYLAMEYLEGLPLDVWFKNQKNAIPLPHVLRIVRDMLRGLAAAHEKGLIHRDIKPANLWIEKGTSRIKLLDFGLTRSQDSSDQMTADGAIVGTPAFMAPEQASGNPVDTRADLFSVGTVMYTLLAGKNPFVRGGTMGTLGAVAYEVQPPLASVRPDVPHEYSDFLDRLLSKKPDGRPANAKVAYQELVGIEKQLIEKAKTSSGLVAVPLVESDPKVWGAITEEEAVKVATVTMAPPEPPRKSHKKLLLGGLFAFFALTLGGIIILITNKDGTKMKVEVPEGAKVEVQKDGKTVATVGGKKAVDEKDPHRRLAARIIESGGTYQIVGDSTDQNVLLDRPFQLEGFVWSKNLIFSNADLDQICKLDSIQWFNITGNISDENVRKLSGSPHAQNWEFVGFFSDQITDQSCHLLAALPLKKMTLSSQKLTGSGLTAIAKSSTLEELMIAYSQSFQEKELQHLVTAPKLASLSFRELPVTDVVFEILAPMKGLRTLNLTQTKVTSAGVKKFREARPDVKVMSDFDAAADADRKAAEYAISLGGTVNLVNVIADGKLKDISTAKQLPAGPLTLQGVYWNNIGGRLTDDSLAQIKDCRELTTLFIWNSAMTDAGVAHLKDLNKLETLALGWSSLTDDSLKHLKGLTKLKALQISYTQITDAGVAELKVLPNLSELRMNYTKVTGRCLEGFKEHANLHELWMVGNPVSDAELVHIARLPALKRLKLNETNITDTGLQSLTALKQLTELEVWKTQVTAAGVARLQKALPRCKIDWDGGGT